MALEELRDRYRRAGYEHMLHDDHVRFHVRIVDGTLHDPDCDQVAADTEATLVSLAEALTLNGCDPGGCNRDVERVPGPDMQHLRTLLLVTSHLKAASRLTTDSGPGDREDLAVALSTDLNNTTPTSVFNPALRTELAALHTRLRAALTDLDALEYSTARRTTTLAEVESDVRERYGPNAFLDPTPTLVAVYGRPRLPQLEWRAFLVLAGASRSLANLTATVPYWFALHLTRKWAVDDERRRSWAIPVPGDSEETIETATRLWRGHAEDTDHQLSDLAACVHAARQLNS